MKDVHLKPYLSNMGLTYCNCSSQSSPKVGIIFGCSFESEIARLTTLVWLLVINYYFHQLMQRHHLDEASSKGTITNKNSAVNPY